MNAHCLYCKVHAHYFYCKVNYMSRRMRRTVVCSIREQDLSQGMYAIGPLFDSSYLVLYGVLCCFKPCNG